MEEICWDTTYSPNHNKFKEYFIGGVVVNMLVPCPVDLVKPRL